MKIIKTMIKFLSNTISLIMAPALIHINIKLPLVVFLTLLGLNQYSIIVTVISNILIYLCRVFYRGKYLSRRAILTIVLLSVALNFITYFTFVYLDIFSLINDDYEKLIIFFSIALFNTELSEKSIFILDRINLFPGDTNNNAEASSSRNNRGTSSSVYSSTMTLASINHDINFIMQAMDRHNKDFIITFNKAKSSMLYDDIIAAKVHRDALDSLYDRLYKNLSYRNDVIKRAIASGENTNLLNFRPKPTDKEKSIINLTHEYLKLKL